MKFDQQIKKLEKAVDSIRHRRGSLRVVVVYPNETEQQAINLANIGPGDQVVIVQKICNKNDPIPTQPKPKKPATKSPAQIEREIEALKTELREDGLTNMEINELMSEPEKSKRNDGLLTVEPSRSDVGRLTR